MRIGDRVEMVDRYRRGGKYEPSSFDGLRGVITRLRPTLMVHLDGERLPMAFDARDLVVLGGESSVALTGAE